MAGESADTLWTALFVGVITLAVYYLLFRRPPVRDRQRNPRGGGAAHPAAARAAAPDYCGSTAANTAAARVPCHVSPGSARIANRGGFNLLSDGMIAFRHCKAASPTLVQEDSTTDSTSNSADQQARNRKDRALILSRLLEMDSTVISSPPAKGSTLVVSVPSEDLDCNKLRRALFLLGTYYNLLLVIAVSALPEQSSASATFAASQNRRKELLATLRCASTAAGSNDSPTYTLTSDALPDHRILTSTADTGRVALVRQLQKVELVLDFDARVKDTLTRFGHKVIVYKGDEATSAGSQLGRCLLA